MTFNESDHPRQPAGKFADKPQSAPQVSLPAPRLVGQLGGYQVKNFKAINMGREGGAFTASIWRDGVRVLTVENSGNGGGNDYTDVKTGRRFNGPEIDAFEAVAAKAHPEFAEYGAGDVFVETLDFLGQIERSSEKQNWPRAECVEANIAEAEKYGPVDDRVKELLRNPDVLSAE